MQTSAPGAQGTAPARALPPVVAQPHQRAAALTTDPLRQALLDARSALVNGARVWDALAVIDTALGLQRA